MACYIKGHGHNNKIYSFDCGIAGQLVEYSIKLNKLEDLITFENMAVSNASIPHILYYDMKHTEDNHILKHRLNPSVSTNISACVVDAVKLDDYFRNDTKNLLVKRFRKPSTENLIIKIDTQGAEPLVFEGMQKILSEFPPIIFEFTPNIYKLTRDPLEFLNGLPEGYVFFHMDSDKNRLNELKRGEFPDFVNKMAAAKPPYTDLLMLPKIFIQSGFPIE
jgi:FkbM family methyltransferase